MAASEKEIDRRLKAIKNGMEKQALPAIIVFSQVQLDFKGACRYISNYRLMTRKEYLLLPLSGEPVLVVPTIGQQARAKDASWIRDVRAGGDTEGMIREIARAARSAGVHDGPIGMVNLKMSVPHYDFECLVAELPGATLKDATPLLDAVRFVKSAEEIEMMRETTAIADSCYERLQEILRPGVNEREVMAEVYRLLTLKGVEDTLILTAKGRSFPCFIGPPGPHVFEEGDHYVFSMEISGPSGYWSQIVRPVTLGKPAPSYERLFAVGKSALDRGAAALIPGNRVSDAVRVVVEEVQKGGFKTGIWCGHGMGMDLGDGIALSAENPLKLIAGMTITIHPHIMSHDGGEGLLLGDTYVVGQGGGENLSRTPCELKRL